MFNHINDFNYLLSQRLITRRLILITYKPYFVYDCLIAGSFDHNINSDGN